MVATLMALTVLVSVPQADLDVFSAQISEMAREGWISRRDWDPNVSHSRIQLASAAIRAARKLAQYEPMYPGDAAKTKLFARELSWMEKELQNELRDLKAKPEDVKKSIAEIRRKATARLTTASVVPDIPANHALYVALDGLYRAKLDRGTYRNVFRGGKPDVLSQFTVWIFLVLRNLEDATLAVEKSGDKARADGLFGQVDNARLLFEACEPRFDAVGFDIDEVEKLMISLPQRLQRAATGLPVTTSGPGLPDTHDVKGLQQPEEEGATVIPDIPENHATYDAHLRLMRAGLDKGLRPWRPNQPLTDTVFCVTLFTGIRNLETELELAQRFNDRSRMQDLLEATTYFDALSSRFLKLGERVGFDSQAGLKDYHQLKARLEALSKEHQKAQSNKR